jgi:lipopolysaccharide export system protein LptA
MFSFCAQAQKITRIELLGADMMTAAKNRSSDASRLIGNVRFKHEGTILRCDSAFLMSESNSLEAFGNVVINNNDSIFIYGNKLYYDGNTKVAQMQDKVRMVDNHMTLTTDFLTYNMTDEIGTYYNGGKIEDANNVLTSTYGYYYASRNEFFFKRNVVLTNPQYVMYSDTLMYNTNTEIAYFFGPTRIISSENLIYCENGWYNTRTDISQYSRNAYMQKNEHTLKGDSLWYDRKSGVGKAFMNVSMIDTVQNVIVQGHKALYHEKNGNATITDSAVATIVENEDSLFLHGDTLFLVLDSANQGESLHAFLNVKFFRYDLQGACDSMVYSFKDSIIELFEKPVLWQNQTQLSAEKIVIRLENQEIKEMILTESSFIIELDDSTQFNQIKGKNINAFFNGGELYRAHVVGSSEAVYYVREDDNSLIGVNKGNSSEMMIYLEDNKVQAITFINNPKQVVYPIEDFPSNEKELKGFKWEVVRRPMKKEDIFTR